MLHYCSVALLRESEGVARRSQVFCAIVPVSDISLMSSFLMIFVASRDAVGVAR